MRFPGARDVSCRLGLIAILIIGTSRMLAAASSPLYARGYSVIPEPQKVELQGGDIQFAGPWRAELGPNVKASDVAVQSLKEQMFRRYGVTLADNGRGKPIELAIRPGSVEIGHATDKNSQAIAAQAYRLELAGSAIRITANAPAGLFYGVDTLVQLVKPSGGKLWLPKGRITDWPDLRLRAILWDDAYHLEHLDVLKAMIRHAAFYKINGFILKICGHFQYKSAAPVVEPYALSPAEYQDLTDYGLRYHVQLIPYLDAPAHDTFILKHPEYAALRAFPQSNYEFCTTNPKTYSLLTGMFQDLMNANKGVKYIVFSTDEPYYVGLAKNSQCDEVDRARQLGSVGKLLAEFETKMSEYLHNRGRTVIFWGEYPLKPSDIASLPSFLVNGEVYGPEFDPVFKAHGIRQMIYTSTGGAAPLFPNYYVLPDAERVHPLSGKSNWVRSQVERVPMMFDGVSFNSARKDADLMGTVIAGWRDAGVNPETYWLGYATGLGYAWHPAAPSPQEATNSFFRLFYGPGSANMGRVYQLLSQQAQFWDDSWDTVASSARKPLFGNSYAIFKPPRPAKIQTIPLPPVPSPGHLLQRESAWSTDNARRLRLASTFYAQNDELVNLLNENLQSVQFNRYNLRVYLTIAMLCRQNLEMLMELQQVNSLLNSAQLSAAQANFRKAVAAVDQALDVTKKIRTQRNTVLKNTAKAWYVSWFPRVAEANGRRHLDSLDDAKDSLGDRTVDLSYLVYRELHLPLGEWYSQLEAARNQYAKRYGLPARTDKLNWMDTQTAAK